jgi:hypothetical protein
VPISIVTTNNENELDALENDDANVSMAIQHASNQVKNLIQEDNWEEQNFMDSFNEGYTQLNLINQFDNNLSVINCGDSGKCFFITSYLIIIILDEC